MRRNIELWRRSVAIEKIAFGRRHIDVWGLAVGVLVLLACAVAVHDGTVGPAEKAVFDAINGLPDWMEPPLWLFQLFGLAIAPLVFAAAAFVLHRRRLGTAFALAVPLKLLFERGVVKQLVERERPGTTIPDAIIRDASVAGLSFPSGHATLAFAVATLAAPYLKRRWQVVLFVLAALNGVARVYLGAHSPLDIVGGAALGLAIGAGLNLVLKVPAGSR